MRACVADADDAMMDLGGCRRSRHGRARCTTNPFLPIRHGASGGLEAVEPCPISHAIALPVYVYGDAVYSGEALQRVGSTDRSLVGQPQLGSE